MGKVSLREILAQARKDEKNKRSREAASNYAMIGSYLRKKGKPKEATLFLRRAIGLSKTSPRLYLHLGLCEMDRGEQGAAKRAMARFTKYALRRKDIEKYRSYLEKHVAEKPLLRKVFYEGLMELDRTDAAPFLAHARASVQEGNAESAKVMIIKALKTKTMKEEVLSQLKKVLTEMGLSEEQQAVKRFEEERISLKELLVLLSDSGDERESDKSKHSVSIREDEYTEEKDLQSLIKDLEKELGIELDEKQDKVTPLVREFRRQSNRVIGNDSKTRIDMAAAFYEMDLKDDARDELSHIKETDSCYLEAQVLLGEILISEGSYLGALEVMQKCLRDGRTNSDILLESKYKIVKIYFKLGDIKQALKMAYDLEEKDSNYRDIRELRAQLQDAAEQVAGVSDGIAK